MLHLFNKVYLEFDDRIEINFDRVVISERYGVQMLEQLDKVAYGELIAYGKSYDDIVGTDFVGFISSLKDFGNRTDKKVMIYCDNASYKRLIAQWFKVILPAISLDEFKTLVDYTIYNQRITANTQLSSVYSMNLNSLWNGLGDIETAWNSAVQLTEAEKQVLEDFNLKYSYEFLISTYISGDTSYKEELRSTLHMFLRRWFKEMFTDNRQMVLLNLTNHKFQEALGIDSELVDITRLDPLSGIPQLEAYADDEIWERDQNKYGVCKLEGLSEEQLDNLRLTLLSVYGKYEGMLIDRSIFKVLTWVEYAASEFLTDKNLDEIMGYFVENPFDTIGVPRFDFQTVNFPLIQYFLAQKFRGEDLSKYRLL